MGNLFSLLTTFNGRINRAKWWLGLVLLGVANVLGGMLLNPEFFTAEEPPPPSWPDTVWQIALLYPLTAITVKRSVSIPVITGTRSSSTRRTFTCRS